MSDRLEPRSFRQDIRPPVLPEPLAERPLAETVQTAVKLCADVEGARFRGGTASGLAGANLEFSGCLFEHCAFADWELKRVSFVDCLFDHCDFSALRLANPAFQRVRFAACRLIGAEFLRAALTNVVWEDCAADYFSLSESKCAHVRFQACRLRESLWQDVKLGDAAFAACDFTAAQFRYTPMEGLDVTTCELSGLQIDPRDLRGMRVTPLQGLMFCSLLGLVIADEAPEGPEEESL